jgi:hypothetical protein
MTTIGMSDGRPREPRRLRQIATWYREFAERASNPSIWEARLRTAKELEQEADRLEEASEPPRETETPGFAAPKSRAMAAAAAPKGRGAG